MKLKYLLIATMAIPCAIFMACGDDDEEPQKTNIETPPDGAILENTDILETVDPEYKPTANYLQKNWHGEYIGWDAKQAEDGNNNGNTTICRELTLNANGTYTNIIAGKLISTGKEGFFKFESEGGTYSYNPSTGYVTYTVEYDSLLNYRSQTYDVYRKKKYYSKEEKSYTEKADFSISANGTRRWVTRDMYLQSLTDKTINIAFAMDPARSSDDTPRDR